MRGPLLMLAGIGLFGLLDANSKLLSEAHGVWQVLLIRFVTILGAAFLMRALIPGWGGPLRTAFPRLHAARAVAMMGSAVGFFMAFTHLPLAEGYLVFFTSPFLVLALAAWLLRERPPQAAWGWCAVGFGGVAVGLAPSLGGGGALAGYFWAAFGTLSYAAVFIMNRQLRAEPGFARVLVWPALLGLAVTLPLGLAEWRAPTPFALAQMMVNGVLVGGATVALAAAFRHASAARLAPFGYSGLVWGLGFDFAIWGRVPGGAMLGGAALVVLACAMSERTAQGIPSGKR